jgi:hypothetical protein
MCSFSHRVSKQESHIVLDLLDQLESVSELLLSLVAETADEIGRKSDPGDFIPNMFDQI